jgi:hypothetical protein
MVWAVVHSMQGRTDAQSAEDAAKLFASWSTQVSAHRCVDVDSIVECVHDTAVSFAIAPFNDLCLCCETGSRAEWTRADWLARPGLVEQIARCLADWCTRWAIPPRFLSVAEMVAFGRSTGRCGPMGLTTHGRVNEFGRIMGPAWLAQAPGVRHSTSGDDLTHWDPGPGCPLDVIEARVRELMEADFDGDDPMNLYLVKADLDGPQPVDLSWIGGRRKLTRLAPAGREADAIDGVFPTVSVPPTGAKIELLGLPSGRVASIWRIEPGMLDSVAGPIDEETTGPTVKPWPMAGTVHVASVPGDVPVHLDPV